MSDQTKQKSIFEELESMGILGGVITTPSAPKTDDEMLGKIQEAAKRVQDASEALVKAATGIQEAIASFSTVLGEAVETPVEGGEGN